MLTNTCFLFFFVSLLPSSCLTLFFLSPTQLPSLSPSLFCSVLPPIHFFHHIPLFLSPFPSLPSISVHFHFLPSFFSCNTPIPPSFTPTCLPSLPPSFLSTSSPDLLSLSLPLSPPPFSLSRLHSNSLRCDCHLAWLSPWLRQRASLGLYTQCSSPPTLRGLNLAELRKSDFACSGTADQRHITLRSKCG